MKRSLLLICEMIFLTLFLGMVGVFYFEMSIGAPGWTFLTAIPVFILLGFVYFGYQVMRAYRMGEKCEHAPTPTEVLTQDEQDRREIAQLGEDVRVRLARMQFLESRLAPQGYREPDRTIEPEAHQRDETQEISGGDITCYLALVKELKKLIGPRVDAVAPAHDPSVSVIPQSTFEYLKKSERKRIAEAPLTNEFSELSSEENEEERDLREHIELDLHGALHR